MSEALPTAARRRHQYQFMVAAVVVTLPGAVISRIHLDWPDPLLALIFGLAIVGAAFLLSWAAEVAQLDISAGLAIAVLAFIAVLPEYAVDLVFALNGGEAFAEFGDVCQSPADAAAGRESDCALALANMTGANRLLIGLGWTMVVFIAWRRLKKRGQRMDGVELERTHAVELSFLSVATVYSLTLPLKSSITLVDSAVLVSIFVLYMIRISKAPAEEPHLVGPAEALGQLSTGARRGAVVGLFLFAATVILLCAEEFAHALVESGHSVGISEFFLVQWLAPLASEAPELLVAGLYAYRLNTNAGLGTLVSSKVNQWTLLVGTLPIAFAIASSSTHGLPIIARQREEVFLTAAQSFFAVVTLLNLTMTLREAGFLFALFWAQFVTGAVVPEDWHGKELVLFGLAYLALGLWGLVGSRREVPRLLHDGFRAKYSELSAADPPHQPH
ncbi:MAG TPA: sodium:proton exchanger [Acidimicrobiia bacterium]|nr:sodium:proton exchanger [Acidimicrobiia bacterium]